MMSRVKGMRRPPRTRHQFGIEINEGSIGLIRAGARYSSEPIQSLESLRDDPP